MKGSEAKMMEYMDGASKRYVIPVYQRKYDWKEDNCRQLYEDLKKIVFDKRDSHFFGSIVSRSFSSSSHARDFSQESSAAMKSIIFEISPSVLISR